MTTEDTAFDLIGSFLSGKIEAMAFCDRFVELWIQYRDAQYRQETPELKIAKLRLLESFRHGEMTEENFHSQWAELFVYSGNIAKVTLFNAVHSSCMVFREFPEHEWEINEQQMRHEIERAFSLFEASHTA